MQSVNFSNFRKNMAAFIDQVNNDHEPVLITRQQEKAAVLMSLEDFKSYEETAYLMRSPENAKRLNHAIEELEAGKGVVREIIEE